MGSVNSGFTGSMTGYGSTRLFANATSPAEQPQAANPSNQPQPTAPAPAQPLTQPGSAGSMFATEPNTTTAPATLPQGAQQGPQPSAQPNPSSQPSPSTRPQSTDPAGHAAPASPTGQPTTQPNPSSQPQSADPAGHAAPTIPTTPTGQPTTQPNPADQSKPNTPAGNTIEKNITRLRLLTLGDKMDDPLGSMKPEWAGKLYRFINNNPGVFAFTLPTLGLMSLFGPVSLLTAGVVTGLHVGIERGLEAYSGKDRRIANLDQYKVRVTSTNPDIKVSNLNVVS